MIFSSREMSRNSKKMETLPSFLKPPILKCCRRFSSDDEDLEQALRNYERYYKLPEGTATVEQLKSSSAGVSGWVDYVSEDDDGNDSSGTEDLNEDDEDINIFHTLHLPTVTRKLQDIYPRPLFLQKLVKIKEEQGDNEVKKHVYKVIDDIEKILTMMVNYIKEVMFSRPDVHLSFQKASSFFNKIISSNLKHGSRTLFSNVLILCIRFYAEKGSESRYKQNFEIFSRLREPYPDFFHELDLIYHTGENMHFIEDIIDHVSNLTLSEVDYNVGVNAFVIPLINGYIFKQSYMLRDFVVDMNLEGNGPYISMRQRLDKLLSGNFAIEDLLLLPPPFKDLCSKSDTFSPNKFVLNVLGHYVGYLGDIAEEAEQGTKTNPFFTMQHYGGGLNKNCKCNGIYLSCCSVPVGYENCFVVDLGTRAVIDIISHLHFLNITEIFNLKYVDKCADQYFFSGFKDNLKIGMNQAIDFFLKLPCVDEGVLLLNLYHILHGAYHNNDFGFRRRVEKFCKHSKVKLLESRFDLIKQSKPFDDFDGMSKRVNEVNFTWCFKKLQNLMNVEMHHPILNSCQMMHSFVIHFIPETNNPKFVGVYDVNKFAKLFCLDYRANGFEYTSLKQEPIDLTGDRTKYVVVKDMSIASTTLGEHLISFLTASLRKTLQNDNVTIADTWRTTKIGERQKWMVSVGVLSNQEHHVDITINDGNEIIHHQIKTTNLSTCFYTPFVDDFEPMVIFYPLKSSKLYLVEDMCEINFFVGGNDIFDVTPNGLYVSLYFVRIDDIFQVIYSLNITSAFKNKLQQIESFLTEGLFIDYDYDNEIQEMETVNDVEREWEDLKKAPRVNAGILKKNGLYPMNDRRDEIRRVLFSSNNDLSSEDAEKCYNHLTNFYHPSLYDEGKYDDDDEVKYHGRKICKKKDGTYVPLCKLPQREKKNCCRYISMLNNLFHSDKTILTCKAIQEEKKNDTNGNKGEDLKNDHKYASLLKELRTMNNIHKYRAVVEKINQAIQLYKGPISTSGFPSLSSLNLSEIPMLNLRGKTLQNLIDMPEDMSSGSKLFHTLCVNNTPLLRKMETFCIREDASNLKSFLPLNLLYKSVADFEGVLRFKIKNSLVIKDDMPVFASFVKDKENKIYVIKRKGRKNKYKLKKFK